MPDTPFAEDKPRDEGNGELFVVALDGFEGPLDLLLELARSQKVDLHKISILALAEQYLAFVEAAKGKLELAADYLVMAAWLTYLKSRLLLPQPAMTDAPDAAVLAAALAERLQHLQVICSAAQAFDERPQWNRDFVLRGLADVAVSEGQPTTWTATLYDFVTAAAQQSRRRVARMDVPRRTIFTLNEARAALHRLIGLAIDWHDLDEHLHAFCATPAATKSVRASALSVTLELVREGKLVIRQDRPFAPLWVKVAPVVERVPT